MESTDFFIQNLYEYVKKCTSRCQYLLLLVWAIKEGQRQKKRQRSSLLFAGTELIQFLAAPAILQQDDLKKGMNSSYSSIVHGVKKLAWQRIGMNGFCLPGSNLSATQSTGKWVAIFLKKATTTVCLGFCIHPYSMFESQ